MARERDSKTQLKANQVASNTGDCWGITVKGNWCKLPKSGRLFCKHHRRLALIAIFALSLPLISLVADLIGIIPPLWNFIRPQPVALRLESLGAGVSFENGVFRKLTVSDAAKDVSGIFRLLSHEKIPTLTIVDLSGLTVRDAHLNAIARVAPLKTLLLKDLKVSSNGMLVLQNLPRLGQIRVSGRVRVKDSHLRCISQIKTLNTLSLEETTLDRSGLKYLSKLTRLYKLILKSTNIQNGDMGNIGKISSLTYLDIANTDITDAGLKHLQPLENLEILNAYREHNRSGPRFTDPGLLVLRSLRSLRDADVRNTGVTAKGKDALKTQ